MSDPARCADNWIKKQPGYNKQDFVRFKEMYLLIIREQFLVLIVTEVKRDLNLVLRGSPLPLCNSKSNEA